MTRPNAPPAEVLASYGFRPASVAAIDVGNINKTFVATRAGERFILQWLNPIFGPEVHSDIEAVTAHLEHKGLRTQRLARTRAGELWVRAADGGVWRALTYVDGEILSAGATARHCLSGGRLLGRFHRAVADLEHVFGNVRPGVHDTPRHLRHLDEVLRGMTAHPAQALVAPVGRAILAAAAKLPAIGPLPPRIVHGDPKLNNVVFSAAGEAVCLIDLDTLSSMTIPIELGDAFRSWCNPVGEDSVTAHFDLELYAAGIGGYAEATAGFLSAVEIEAIPVMIETVCLELASRFCADALEERYFGWDRRRFRTASEHNLLRARCQLGLAASVAAQRPAISGLTRDRFAAAAPRQ
ncbi:MAG: aminoglycoside phosphotransferase family protein [Deltaproteobacteria bacterium]|nr:aminoglycoside phosphotransferase family protein [Deltaproteobacteria bacterium]